MSGIVCFMGNVSYFRKCNIAMKHKSNLPVGLLDEVDSFFQIVPPGRLSRNLRRLLLNHLTLDKEAYGMNSQDLYVDMIWLFELLDRAEDELLTQKTK